MSSATATPKTDAQIAAEKKAEKLAQWTEAANKRVERKGGTAPSAKKLSYLYDLVRAEGVADELQKEVYTAMLFGGTPRQVDFFIDVLKGKATWTPREKPAAAAQPENAEAEAESAPAAEPREPVTVSFGGEDFDNPFDSDVMPW